MLMKTLPLYLQDASQPQAQVCQRCEVRRSAVFAALDDSGLERIHGDIASPTLLPEERVYARGSLTGHVYTVRSGIVRFERVTEAGHRRIVRIAGRGDLIGQEALLRQGYRGDAVACTPLALCRIPVALMEELGEHERRLPHELMSRWQRALDESESWATELTIGAARRRMLQLLSRLQEHRDEAGVIWLPRRDQMGDMLNMTVETCSRLVSALRRDGVLELIAPQQARLDPVRLKQATAEANR
jgi:CRP-like cAMP-binding protein